MEVSSLEGGNIVLDSASLIATLCMSLLDFSMAAGQLTNCLLGWGYRKAWLWAHSLWGCFEAFLSCSLICMEGLMDLETLSLQLFC